MRELLQRRNSLRRERVNKELAILQPLPARRLEDYSVKLDKVTRNSTISVRRNLYSVPSQLIGERVEVRIFAEQLQVWFGGVAWPLFYESGFSSWADRTEGKSLSTLERERMKQRMNLLTC